MDNNQYDNIPEKVVKIETEVDIMKGDITSIKDDVKDLKEKQTDQTINLNQTNNLLGKHIALMNLTLKQNSEIISTNTQMLKQFKEDTDNKINQVNGKLDNKKDTFKDFLIDLSKSVLKLAVSGGLLYLLYEIGKGQITNLFM